MHILDPRPHHRGIAWLIPVAVVLGAALACGGSEPAKPPPVVAPTPAKTKAKAKAPAELRADGKPRVRLEHTQEGPFEQLAEPETRAGLDAGPDILFITWDTTRVDHLSTYGYHRETSPWLTSFAEESLVFDWWIVPMSTTLPSHTTMFTGLQPGEHGILANAMVTGERFVPSESVQSLPAFLGERGYLVGGFVGAAPLKKSSGISAGFHVWSEPKQPSRRAGKTIDDTLAWLETVPDDQPLFLWVHLYDPHYPYRPPSEYKDRFQADDATRKHLFERQITGALQATDKAVQPANLYDAEIRYTDDQTKRLVEAWKGKRDWGRTVAVVAADHGEGLMQHGHHQHGVTWHEQLRSPLLVRVPGRAPGRVTHPVGGHDLLPTLLSLVDLPDEDVLASQITGVDVLAEDFEPRAIFSRTSARQIRDGEPSLFALTDRKWKAILHPDGKLALFDLEADPHEHHDVSADHPERVEQLRDAIRTQMADQQKRGAALGAGKTEALDEGTLKQLEELGYLE